MKDIIMTNLEKIIECELYYIDDESLNDIRKNNLKNNIIKNLRNEFSKDNFIYLMIDNNHCGHKIKRGKNDGNFCCKKITANGNKKNYVCTKHNKDHVPKMRIPKIKKTKITLAKNDIISDKNNISQKDKSLIVNNNRKYQKISDISDDKKEIQQNFIGDNNKLKYNDITKINLSTNNFSQYNNSKNNISIKQSVPSGHLVDDILAKNNTYKKLVLNQDGIYTKLIKEFPLLNFCINKLRRSKYKKNYFHNSFLYL